jgi:hypothetical protein
MTIKHIFLKTTFLAGIISLANLAPVRAQTLEATVADVLRTHPRLSAARANALGVECKAPIPCMTAIAR